MREERKKGVERTKGVRRRMRSVCVCLCIHMVGHTEEEEEEEEDEDEDEDEEDEEGLFKADAVKEEWKRWAQRRATTLRALTIQGKRVEFAADVAANERILCLE